MTPVENLLQRLKKVRGRNGSWTACCPAHDDKGPSLSVRETPDGRVLLHCFAGCETQSVVESVGLGFQDLYPPEEKRHEYPPAKPAVKPAFYASDLLRVVAFEALVVQIVALDIAEGRLPSERDRERMKLAFERIDEAMRCANVG